MGEPSDSHDLNLPGSEASMLGAASGAIGVILLACALWAVQPVQFNVANHTAQAVTPSGYIPSVALAVALAVGLVGLGALAGGMSARGVRLRLAMASLWPLVLCAPLAAFAATDQTPPFALSFLLLIGAGWAAFRAAASLPERRLPCSNRHAHAVALGSILLGIVALTLVHTLIQVNYFEHFMLGHADIGHFAEELKNALAGRGLRSDSFANTRLGWHFVPLMYVLVPGYALWPTPVYLMVCSALVVHVVAIPAYFLARRLSGSVVVGWLWGLAWLALPVVSRLVYGNTYGFQWNNVTMPVLAVLILAGITGRRRTSLVLVVVLLLCRETAAAVTLGWGLYVALFTPRRREGIALVVVSLLYAALCTQWLIPHFSAAGRYERLDLFGELGGSFGELASAAFLEPGLFFARFARRQAVMFLLVLLVPMALLSIRGWRLAVAALPSLLLVLLMENEAFLSIKFWHHAPVVVFMFFAGITSMRPGGGAAPTDARPVRLPVGRRTLSASALNRGMGAAVLTCAVLGHYLFGFSPVAKAYEVVAGSSFLRQPDPRMETVRRLRAEIPRARSIVASERLAAHFTDYRRIYTGKRQGALDAADFVLIDRADGWDRSGLVQRVEALVADRRFVHFGEFGGILVFQRRPDVPVLPLN